MTLWLCLLLVVFVINTQVTGFTVDDCPSTVPRDQNVRVHGNNCFYFELTSHHDFPTAQMACQHLEGDLVTVPDRETQQFLFTVLQDDFHSHFAVWIGLRNSGSQSAFVWPDGQEASYLNWASDHETVGLPDNGCVAMDPANGGQWRLFPCSLSTFYQITMPFVCQFPIRSECQQCGDVGNDVACTHLDETFGSYATCDTDKLYCMNDVIESSGMRRVFKRCASETDCQQQWFQNTSGNAACMALDNNVNDNGHGGDGDLECHFCCFGNDCNRGLMPERDSLYTPPGLATTASTITTTSPLTTTATTTTSTPATTTKATTTAAQTTAETTSTPTQGNLPGSRCQTCGNLETGVACSPLSLLRPTFTTCDDSTPYCMNDIIQANDNGVVTVKRFKRCVDEVTCNKLWFEDTSSINHCVNFEPGESSDDLDCHLCCHGDECNRPDLPPVNTRYRP